MSALLSLINERVDAFLHNLYVRYNRLDLYLSKLVTPSKRNTFEEYRQLKIYTTRSVTPLKV